MEIYQIPFPFFEHSNSKTNHWYTIEKFGTIRDIIMKIELDVSIILLKENMLSKNYHWWKTDKSSPLKKIIKFYLTFLKRSPNLDSRYSNAGIQFIFQMKIYYNSHAALKYSGEKLTTSFTTRTFSRFIFSSPSACHSETPFHI